jgi:hypothetical protein
VEHDERADELEREAEKLDGESDRIGEHIEDAKQEWEAKQADPAVPGAQPEPGEQEESVPGVAADEDTLREEGGP